MERIHRHLRKSIHPFIYEYVLTFNDTILIEIKTCSVKVEHALVMIYCRLKKHIVLTLMSMNQEGKPTSTGCPVQETFRMS